jgi:hypothetical protein
MDPHKVRPAKFNVFTVIYDDGEFSVAYGKWENDEPRLAMRWNGDTDNDIGYPSQGGNPLWFQLPNDGIWTREILKAIDNIAGFEDRIEELNSKL